MSLVKITTFPKPAIKTTEYIMKVSKLHFWRRLNSHFLLNLLILFVFKSNMSKTTKKNKKQCACTSAPQSVYHVSCVDPRPDNNLHFLHVNGNAIDAAIMWKWVGIMCRLYK